MQIANIKHVSIKFHSSNVYVSYFFKFVQVRQREEHHADPLEVGQELQVVQGVLRRVSLLVRLAINAMV